MNDILDRLSGGDLRSEGRAAEVAQQVVDDPDRLPALSSGGICAFTVAWERPDAFRKVMSHIGSFTDIRGGHVFPSRIRKEPMRPLRVYPRWRK
jgi:enterochelin esterase family protein